MKNDSPEAILTWLQQAPRLPELAARFPADWERVQAEVAAIVANGNPEQLKAMTDGVQRRALPGPIGKQARAALLSEHIRHRMVCLLVKQYSFAVATGVNKGKVRFDLINGFLAQKLLFARGLERKMTSMFWFRLVWPLIWRKQLLMPLVEKRGIYCFYSKQLVQALAAIIGARNCIEIAAGDGTLTRFLTSQGIRISASDNQSWKSSIRYPDHVARCDAREALRAAAPEVVICSWPPARNDFERHVFKTSSVQTYIVIGSKFEFASGNWADYRAQTAFAFEEAPQLSQLVLPPELGSAVYIFRRRAPQA